MRRRFSRYLLLGVAAVGLAGAARFVSAAPRDRRFESARKGIRLEGPPGWELSTHTGYPSIVAVLVHASGARISISLAPTNAEDARSLVDGHRPALAAAGLRIVRIEPGVRETLEVHLLAPAGDEAIRQAYLVRVLGDRREAVIVTLACNRSALVTRGADFTYVLRHLALTVPAADRPDGSAAVDRTAD